MIEQQRIPLVIGIAHAERPVAFDWALAYGALQVPNMLRHCAVSVGRPVDAARNEIAAFARESGASWLWFLDDDVEVPRHALRRLLYDIDNADDDVMVVGGIYPSRTDPVEPVVYLDGMPFWRWRVGELFQCDALGAGCMLIRMSLFDHLEEPWFKRVDETQNGVMVFIDDDRWFCQKVRDAGFKIMADASVICVHHDAAKGKRYSFSEDSYPLRNGQLNAQTCQPVR